MLQLIGLNKKALVWLETNCVKEGCDPCPHCGKPTNQQLKTKIYHFEELFPMDGVHLKEYETTKGRVIREVVQAVPWSSGPVVFLCLEKETKSGKKKRLCEWSQKEIEHIGR